MIDRLRHNGIGKSGYHDLLGSSRQEMLNAYSACKIEAQGNYNEYIETWG